MNQTKAINYENQTTNLWLSGQIWILVSIAAAIVFVVDEADEVLMMLKYAFVPVVEQMRVESSELLVSSSSCLAAGFCMWLSTNDTKIT